MYMFLLQFHMQDTMYCFYKNHHYIMLIHQIHIFYHSRHMLYMFHYQDRNHLYMIMHKYQNNNLPYYQLMDIYYILRLNQIMVLHNIHLHILINLLMKYIIQHLKDIKNIQYCYYLNRNLLYMLFHQLLINKQQNFNHMLNIYHRSRRILKHIILFLLKGHMLQYLMHMKHKQLIQTSSGLTYMMLQLMLIHKQQHQIHNNYMKRQQEQLQLQQRRILKIHTTSYILQLYLHMLHKHLHSHNIEQHILKLFPLTNIKLHCLMYIFNINLQYLNNNQKYNYQLQFYQYINLLQPHNYHKPYLLCQLCILQNYKLLLLLQMNMQLPQLDIRHMHRLKDLYILYHINLVWLQMNIKLHQQDMPHNQK